MAQLVTTGGIKISFDPAGVFAVSDHDAETDEAVTCVYGVSAGPVQISETVGGFLGRMGLTAKFARLTRPNSTPIWVCGSAVSEIRPAVDGEYEPPVRSVVSVGTLTQAVCEDAAAATAAVDAHGGKL